MSEPELRTIRPYPAAELKDMTIRTPLHPFPSEWTMDGETVWEVVQLYERLWASYEDYKPIPDELRDKVSHHLITTAIRLVALEGHTIHTVTRRKDEP